jgi:Protein of unknown function (DUF732)
MNKNMTRPGPLRWLARLTIPMMAGVALVSSTAIASADAGPHESAYFAQLHAVGLHWPSSSDGALIEEAQYVCHELTRGWTPQQIANGLYARFDKRRVTLLDVGTLVNTAHNIYCPGNVFAGGYGN